MQTCTQHINGPLVSSTQVAQVTWSASGHAFLSLICLEVGKLWEMQGPEGESDWTCLVKSKAAKDVSKYLTYAGKSPSKWTLYLRLLNTYRGSGRALFHLDLYGCFAVTEELWGSPKQGVHAPMQQDACWQQTLWHGGAAERLQNLRVRVSFKLIKLIKDQQWER